ncbi:hypothetical protein [Methanobrevibacter sp. DSM 116169]|uniref:hypothetical protein n=1 Tax=Methanobrevibacter sp. DSM 116169 TaxID=3242727 RepID=UPI0038FC7B47
MGIIEVIAIIILILAVLILIYYYLQSNPSTMQAINSYIPSSYGGNNVANDIEYIDEDEDFVDDEDKDSMSKKIKVKLNDIDMSSFNTDAFSKKIDAFLDEKSDELIQDWELATKTDLADLEDRFDNTTKSIDSLEKKFNNFKEDSDKKFDNFENRIQKLEESNE